MITEVKKAAVARFTAKMWVDGIHGPKHWERVRENGLYLVKHSGGDPLVVELFAYLHDCCRESDGADHDHGLRAAEFSATLRGEILTVTDEQFELLFYACEFHEKGKTTNDPTIGSCWDADRLDLGRVAIKPSPRYLSTDRAKRKSVIDWAYQRSRGKKARLKQ